MQGEISSYSSIYQKYQIKLDILVAVLRLEKPMEELLSELNDIKRLKGG